MNIKLLLIILVLLASAYEGVAYTEQDCRNCHGSNLADRHHALKRGCTDCHKMLYDNTTDTYYPEVIRDCVVCHGSDPHGGCVQCHTKNSSARYYVNINLFGRHANINTTDGANNVTDADCNTCHHDPNMKMKLGAANASNTYFCQDCHTSSGTVVKPTDTSLIKDGLRHGKTDCKWCHIAGNSMPRPLPLQYRYHPNGPKGTAAGKDCLSCHYYANLVDLPFHAPGEAHSSYIGPDEGGCSSCHSSDDYHLMYPLNAQTPPSISGLSVTTPVTSGTPVHIQATVTDDMLQVAAARYQVTNASGVVIDWTDMNPGGGRYSLQNQDVYANISTSNLKGTYTINVRGMASAPRTDASLPYYPLNGQWSGIISAQFTVNQPAGYVNGTVSDAMGNISGATVTTDTGASAMTNDAGFYSLRLTNGSYLLTASKEPEYYTGSATVTITADSIETRNIVLTLKPTGTISGTVKTV